MERDVDQASLVGPNQVSVENQSFVVKTKTSRKHQGSVIR